MHKLQKLILISFLLTVPVISRSQTEKEQKHAVEVRFIQSPYADYLFYLLYHSTGQFSQLETVVPLGKIPSLDQLISLPEQAASEQISSYSQLYPLVERYRGATKAVARVVHASEIVPNVRVYRINETHV